MAECAHTSRSRSPTARSRSLLERPLRKRCERRFARDWVPAGLGLRKAGDGDGDGAGEASEGVELEREEEGAERASWREAASELVVDLGTSGGGGVSEGQMEGRGSREEAPVSCELLPSKRRQTTGTKIKQGKVAELEGYSWKWKSDKTVVIYKLFI